MKSIFDYITEATPTQVKHVLRTNRGMWTLALKDDKNYLNRRISSPSMLSDNDVKTIRELGIKVFDYYQP